MRTRVVVGVAGLAVAALGLSMIARAGAAVDRATGGGQILNQNEDGDDIGGAGDTIAFEAHNDAATGDDATGNVLYIDRSSTNPQGKGTGKDAVVRHGSVSCLIVMGGETEDDPGTAKLAGSWDTGGFFEIIVTDNGQGQDDDDVVTVQQVASDPTCEEQDNDDDDETLLGRGNVQVYDNGQPPA